MAEDDKSTAIRPVRARRGHGPDELACVEVMSGSASGSVLSFDQAKSVIGRSSSAQITLDDDGVSRNHAKVVISDDGIVNLLDLQSTNGTFLNGARIDVAILREGDRIQIGPDVTLRFCYLAPDVLQQRKREGPVAAAPDQPVPLSARELEVAQLVAEGLSNPEVAKRLFISPRTVTTHLVRIYDRLGIHSRSGLTRYIVERGLVSKPED